jgi:hypothetical protein
LRFREDQHVFVGDEVLRGAGGACPADGLELEERWPGDQPAVSDGGEQCHAPVDRYESGTQSGADDR